MRRQSVAARRFYRAFYQWATVISHHPHHHHSPRRLPVCQRSLQTSASFNDEHTGHAEPKIRKHFTRLPISRSRSISDAVPHQPVSVPERWHTQPIQTSPERPFDWLTKNDDVVRYRSEFGLMLECAVAGDTLEVAQRSYGERLEKLATRHGARVELQNLQKKADPDGSDAPDNKLHSVLISGTFAQVVKAYENITNAKRNSTPARKVSDSAATGSDPERDNGPNDRTPKAWLNLPVQSAAEVPLNTLRPPRLVVRERSPHFIRLDIAITPADLATLQHRYGPQLKALQERQNAKVEVQNSSDNSLATDDSKAMSFTYVLSISAPYPNAQRTYSAIFGLISEKTKRSHNNSQDVSSANASMGVESKDLNITTSGVDAPFFRCLIELPTDAVRRWLFENSKIRKRAFEHSNCIVSRPGIGQPSTQRWLEGPSKDDVDRTLEILQEEISGYYTRKKEPFQPIQVLQSGLGIARRPQAERDPTPSYKIGLPPTSSDEAPLANATNPRPLHSTGPSGVPCRFTIQVKGQKADLVMDSVIGRKGSSILKLRSSTGCGFVKHRGSLIEGKGSRSSVEAFIDAMKNNMSKAAERFGAEIRVSTNVFPDANGEVKDTRSTNVHPPIDIKGSFDPEELAQLGEDVRTVIRGLTHPVVLITSREVDDKDSLYHGAQLVHSRGVTVSSFNTVTLQPQPIISFNIKIPSRTWDAIKSSSNLRVHLLNANGKGAAIADVFTKPYDQAHEGFHRLEDMGVDVLTFPGSIPPRVFLKDGILAQLRATLLLDRCVEIADHVIVVARVDACKFTDESGLRSTAEMGSDFLDKMSALSYARKRYRGFGTLIDLARLPAKDARSDGAGERRAESNSDRRSKDLIREVDHDDPFTLVDTKNNVKSAKSRVEPNERSPIAAPSHDPIYNVLRSTRDAAREGYAVDINKLWREADEGMSKEAQEEEEDYDFGFDRPQHASARGQTVTRDASRQLEILEDPVPDGPLWGPDELAREESGRLSSDRKTQAAFNLGALADGGPTPSHKSYAASSTETEQPRGLGSTGRRSYSTFSGCSRVAFTRRTFSSSTLSPQKSGQDHTNTPRLIEPGALKTTVADFLGVPDNNMPYKKHAVRGLIKINKAARAAELRLEEEKKKLTREEILQLQHDIRTNDRIVTRKLAWNAAYDLRLMLDKGRVDFKRAQFLESMVEKGQALLLDDAKNARQLLEQGKIDRVQFKGVKEKLEKDHAVLVTETNRLRQFVDEEGEDWRDGDE